MRTESLSFVQSYETSRGEVSHPVQGQIVDSFVFIDIMDKSALLKVINELALGMEPETYSFLMQLFEHLNEEDPGFLDELLTDLIKVYPQGKTDESSIFQAHCREQSGPCINNDRSDSVIAFDDFNFPSHEPVNSLVEMRGTEKSDWLHYIVRALLTSLLAVSMSSSFSLPQAQAFSGSQNTTQRPTTNQGNQGAFLLTKRNNNRRTGDFDVVPGSDDDIWQNYLNLLSSSDPPEINEVQKSAANAIWNSAKGSGWGLPVAEFAVDEDSENRFFRLFWGSDKYHLEIEIYEDGDLDCFGLVHETNEIVTERHRFEREVPESLVNIMGKMVFD